jgi:predicted molibdopterin-dependent oxidoreductase YjgC
MSRSANRANDHSKCGCSAPNVRDKRNNKSAHTDGTITIDGKSTKFSSSDCNIVDVADLAKISIPAPCYRADKKHGCCNSCVIEINGEKKYACNSTPESGMNIIVEREDLKEIRRQKLKDYQINLKNGSSCGCQAAESNSCCG